MVELQRIATEQRNPNTAHIDTLSTLDMVKLINQEDHNVADAVAAVTPKIAEAIDVIADRLSNGGRLIYSGCGTSGRLGILDAVECPPTYSTDPELVQGPCLGDAYIITKPQPLFKTSGAVLYKKVPFCSTLSAGGSAPS